MDGAHTLPEELTDAVYRAALEPRAWGDVMQSMQHSFPSEAQTFYLLHVQPRRVQPVSLVGIAPAWVRSFNELYFRADNPWMRLTQQLHRPGIIRTNVRLDRMLRERGALYRSTYYNEWMRPQGFRHTLGSTLLCERGILANITLMRAPDRKPFSPAEVRRFEALNRHMTRALQMSAQLESSDAGTTSTALIDALPQALAVVDAQRRVLHANAPMQALLRRKQGLALRDGRLEAAQAPSLQAFLKYFAEAFGLGSPGANLAPPPPLRLPDAGSAGMRLTVMPLVGRLGRTLIAGPTALLMVAEEGVPPGLNLAALCSLHGYTPAEGRLAELLARGHDLKDAAQQLGVTYGTARVYLKAVFEKTRVHSQAQLVARLLGPAS